MKKLVLVILLGLFLTSCAPPLTGAGANDKSYHVVCYDRVGTRITDEYFDWARVYDGATYANKNGTPSTYDRADFQSTADCFVTKEE